MNNEKPILVGQIYFDIRAMEGWQYVKILKVTGDLVEVSFPDPKPYWVKNVTGVMNIEDLRKRYTLASNGR